MLLVFGVYAYRDIWPYATFTEVPADQVEGWFMWAKVVTITITGMFVPLFMPRRYIPVDPTVWHAIYVKLSSN